MTAFYRGAYNDSKQRILHHKKAAEPQKGISAMFTGLELYAGGTVIAVLAQALAAGAALILHIGVQIRG